MSQIDLTGEERHQLLAVLKELDPTAPHEQRRNYRRNVLTSGWIQRVGSFRGRGVFKAVIVNVSKRGLRLLCRGSFERGDRLIVPLKFEDGSQWRFLCEVRNIRATDDGKWQVGVVITDRMENPGGRARIPGDWLM